jgi:hypothetical protein
MAPSPQARRASRQPTSGFLVITAAVLLSSCWRALEDPDPALLPPAADGYGWQAGTRAYAAWPLGALWPQKLAYFLQHLPQLMLHTNLFHR